ncbi:MAG TPA: hypothetical protein VHT91_29220 [Kofleriaceae bacterium]|jgi:hypothetical protein|nr:hypothetical protein [Kofleriaceae bacterium]
MTSLPIDRNNGDRNNGAVWRVNGSGHFHVFMACPITGLVDPKRHELPSDYEQFIRELYQFLRFRADRVFLALDREGWGKALMPAEVCTPLDFAEMQRCSVMVAYPGRSFGVGVELGWASALGKPIILLLEPTLPPSPLVDGLFCLPGANVQRVTVGGPPNLATARALEPELDHALSRLAGTSGERVRTDSVATAP